jgi:hypothetical protein
MNEAKTVDQRPKGVPSGTSRRRKQSGRVMATITSGSLLAPAASRSREPGLRANIGAFWRQFFVRAFDPYRPELHYMRGPGPACRAKQRTLSPEVKSMIGEIQAAKRRRPF